MNDFGWLASTWLLRTLAAGGALLLLAWLALRFTRDPARRQRLAAWSFRGAVLIAILGFFPAWLTIPISLSEPVPLETAKAAPATHLDSQPDEAAMEGPLAWERIPAAEVAPIELKPEAMPMTPIATEAPADSRGWYPWLLGAYGTLAAIAVLQLLLALAALIRLRRSSSPAPEHIEKLAGILAGPCGAPQVRLSTRIASPVCFGWFRPTILLPELLLKTARAGEIRWVLAHELDHLRRGDPRTGLWVGLARVLYFVVPWFWAVRRELRLAQEYLADAAAAAGRPADYAAFLVSLSARPSWRGAPLGAVAVRAGRTDLYRRVSMLTQSSPVRDGCSRGWSILTAGGALAAAVAFSGIGFADDAKTEQRVEVEVKFDDAKQEKKDDEKKAERKEGERKPDAQAFQIRIAGSEEVQKITKALSEALEKGNIDEAKKLTAKLSEVLKSQPMIMLGHGAAMRIGGAPQQLRGAPVLGQARVRVLEDEAVKKMEEKLESLKKAMESVKDSPEARDALEKTIAEFKKKIDEARKNGELKAEGAAPPAQFQDQLQGIPALRMPIMPEAFAARAGGRLPGEPKLGIQFEPVPNALYDQLDLPRGSGIVVTKVFPGSAAEKAGLKVNDVLLSVAGKSVNADGQNVAKILGELKAEAKYEVTVLRKGKKETIKDVVVPAAKVEDDRRGGEKKIAFSSMSTSVNNGDFKIEAKNDEGSYHITGTLEDGKPVAKSIVITHGDARGEYSMDKLPKADRAAVEQLLRSVGGSSR